MSSTDLTAAAVIVSVFAQLIALFQLRRSLGFQAKRADIDHARRMATDRADRLMRAYAALHRAAGLIEETFRDLMLFPKGHPYPGIISPVGDAEWMKHNPFDFVESRWQRAKEISAEAEAVIVLDHQEDEALVIYRRLDGECYDLYVDCVSGTTPQDAMQRHERFMDGIRELEGAARATLATIAPELPPGG